MLPDITQQYLEKPFRYTRRPIKEDPPIEIIAECEFELCGCKIYDGQDYYTYDHKIFCSQYHVNEYKEMEADGEL
jgi:hypothetical protein